MSSKLLSCWGVGAVALVSLSVACGGRSVLSDEGVAGIGGTQGGSGSSGSSGSSGAGQSGSGGVAGDAGQSGAGGVSGDAGMAGSGGSGTAAVGGAGGVAGGSGSAGAPGGTAGSAGSPGGSAGSAGAGAGGSAGTAGAGAGGSAGTAGAGGSTVDFCPNRSTWTCDPVQGTGCNGQGEACDIAGNGNGLQCFPPPNDVQVGGACNDQNGPFCTPGATCLNNICTKYCCTDADCSGTACGPFQGNTSDSIGVCDQGAGGAGGSGGAAGSSGAGGSAGSAGGPTAAGCDMCLQAQCSNEFANCAQNNSCSARLSCVESTCALDPNIDVFQCVMQCSQGTPPGGGMALFQLIQCGRNACGTDCPGL